jgi:peptidoglycan/LPS O-acetylase OafA/YrhL
LHTWSLSLEEQFYLVIPVLLGLFFKFRRTGWVFPALGGICLASFAFSIFWVENHPEVAFYLLPARAWELGVGSLVAFCMPVSRAWVRNGMAWLGLLGILCPFFFYSSQTSFPGLAALPPVAGAALLFGDGIITPAISVLSAVEGLKIITPALEPYIVPVTIAIFIALFLVQRAGSERVGAFFGPITILWFFALAAGGLRWIVQDPGVFACVNPKYAIELFLHNGKTASLFTGAGRFDRRIQRQDVGLKCDAVNNANDVCNLARAGANVIHTLNNSADHLSAASCSI